MPSQLKIDALSIVADLVHSDHRTANILTRYGINYCCGGNTTLKAACEARDLETEIVLGELNRITGCGYAIGISYESWPLDFLSDYIVNAFHAYMNLSLPFLHSELENFAIQHKRKYPLPEELPQRFATLSKQIISYQHRNEDVIFPYIRQIVLAERRKESYGKLFVRTLGKPLASLDAEQKKLTEMVQQINHITAGYSFPDTACTSHRVIFQKLQEMENELLHELYLERNFIIPQAMQIERNLLLQ